MDAQSGKVGEFGEKIIMKVLYISHSVDRYGATIALLNIMREMVKRGVEVSLMCSSDKGFLVDEVRKVNGIKVYPMFGYPSMLLFPGVKMDRLQYVKYWIGRAVKCTMFQWRTYKLIKSVRPDIVHCNSAVNDYALLGCKLMHTPHVWHAREYIDKDFGCRVFPSMSCLRWKLSLEFNHTIAITKGVFEHYGLSTSKDTIIYDGVIDEHTESVKLADTPFAFQYFLFVGTMGEGKGVHCVVEQFSKFAERNTDVHLVLACGYDENDDYYKRCVKLGELVADRIHFVGYRTDVYQLMAGAIALVMPSMFEGFGFTTAEAMYNGTLVIGRNTAGTKEQFDIGLEQTGNEIGLRFDSDDEMPLLMKRALTEDFSEMRKRARRVVVDNYTTQKSADKLFLFYECL